MFVPDRSTVLEPVYVDSQKGLDDVCAICRAEKILAFDTEFVMEDRYEPEVSLIQVATSKQVAIIDPYAKIEVAPLWEIIADESIEVVLHAAQEDLGLAVQHSGKVPRNIFDVQIAAGLVGLDYPLSLQRLVQAVLHVRLHKSKTLTDWRKRPLTASQIQYAAEDVGYLLPVQAKLVSRLRRLNRQDWAGEEFSRFEGMGLYRRVETERVMKVKGAGSLRGQPLAILRDLFAWREALARRVNRPARVVLKDYLLIEIARQGISDPHDLRDLRGLSLGDRDLRAMARVVDEAKKAPPVDTPHPKSVDVETPEESALTALLTGLIRSHCLDHDLAYSLVATQRTIREIIRRNRSGNSTEGNQPEPALLSGWRGRAVGGVLRNFLNGRGAVRIAQESGDLKIKFTTDPRS